MSRCLLHVTRLEAFKGWLDAEGIAHRPGKGTWQELQVQVLGRGGWSSVYSRADMPEHYTIDPALEPLVRRFCKELKP